MVRAAAARRSFRDRGRNGLAPGTQALQDAAVTGDCADQNRLGCDLAAGEHDALSKLRALAHDSAVAEHHRAHQASARAHAYISPDPHRPFDLNVRAELATIRHGHTGADLRPFDAQVQLAAEGIERSLPELRQRADVVPV